MGGDAHDGPMPMDYFVWLLRGARLAGRLAFDFEPDTARKASAAGSLWLFISLLIGAFVPSIAIAGFANLQGLTMLGMYLLGTLAALGVVLAMICALFPWYIFFNQEQFGPPAMKFEGTEVEALVDDAEHDRAVVQAEPGMNRRQAALRTLAVEAAKSSKSSVRRAALRILSYFGDLESLGPVLEAVTDPDPRVRASIVQVTNLGITVKDSPQNTLIFVTRLDTGQLDPLLGRSYYQIAMASRSRHRSQDMGRPLTPGPQVTVARPIAKRRRSSIATTAPAITWSNRPG